MQLEKMTKIQANDFFQYTFTCIFYFPILGHVMFMLLWAAVSFKFVLIHMYMYA